MGSSESKLALSAPIKPEPAIKNNRVAQLIDPRSPSAAITRTPIQINGPVEKAVPKSGCPLAFTDPRSPTTGISRTPVREVMRATVGTLTRRLGMLFHNETEGKAPDAPEEVSNSKELASTEPLLTPLPVRTFGSTAEHTNLLATPVLPPLESVGDPSPFVFLEKPQSEVELETEANISLEEAEEARESPINKRMSLSLITCHEGETSCQVFAEVHHTDTKSPEPSVLVDSLRDGEDHPNAPPSFTVETESPVESILPIHTDEKSHAESQVAEQKPSSEETKELPLPSAPAPSNPPTAASLVTPELGACIRCPTFDPKSPSQLVFKPQWLGKGFGATGMKARGVQGRNGRGGSSPLAVAVAVKKMAKENKGRSGKRNQKGTEGRSPLQILKETNSPRDKRPQMKLKMSTPDKQRLGQMDFRVLEVSLDKENR